MTARQRERGASPERKRTPLGPATSESSFQKQVVDLAHLHGWQVAHFRTAPTQAGGWATPVGADGKGFPDLVLVRERVVFAELKSMVGRVRPEQVEWMRLLGEAGAEVHLWRPCDLVAISRVLNASS